jgi:glutamine amidotransferase
MSAPEITVIDYGVGNLLSVRRGLEHCGARVTVTADPEVVKSSAKVVLPGVGAFRSAMETLHQLNLVDAIREVAARGTPLLGICLGMQLLLDASEEFGVTQGLGLIPGNVVAIPSVTTSGESQKIPHIGWNMLDLPAGREDWRATLLEDNTVGDAAYFVHSFMAMPADPVHRVADANYGGHAISAVIARDNIAGCQFHPEKSGEVGLKILRRFCFG